MIFLSASALSCFRDCKLKYYYQYIMGCRRTEDNTSQRMGTGWHTLLELVNTRTGEKCPVCRREQDWKDRTCPICNNTRKMPDGNRLELAALYLDYRYANIPVTVSLEDMMIERTILLYSLSGYMWRYNDKIPGNVIANELYFKLPVVNPRTGRTLPGARVIGKIDKLVLRPDGQVAIREHKTTSQSVDPASKYWDGLNVDIQTGLYVYAAQQMQLAGELERFGIKATDPPISLIEYDVLHKPTIRPKKLTQADSKALIGGGNYCGTGFDAKWVADNRGLEVNGTIAEVTLGKKGGTFAIRETPDMYGARLRLDMSENPDNYFARHDLVRTPCELETLKTDVMMMYETIRFMLRNDMFFHNFGRCEDYGGCDYRAACYANKKITENDIPAGLELTYKKESEDTNGKQEGSN